MLGRNERGAIYVEFLVVILPFLMVIFGIVQAAMLYVAATLTQHSAHAAARAAVVVLDDDPRYYGGARRNDLSGGTLASDPVDDFIATFRLGGGASGTGARDEARLQVIRSAASIPLLAVSPPVREETGAESVADVLGAPRASDRAGGAARYNRSAVAVTFPESPGESSLRWQFDPHEDVTVRVTYLYHCGVPLIRRVMCDSLEDVLGSSKAKALSFAEIPGGSGLESLSGARFRILQAEATLPNHGASYEY